MSTAKTSKKSTLTLRRAIKKAVDELSSERLHSLADYVFYLKRPTLEQILKQAEKDIAEGKGVPWPKDRSDV